MYKYLIKTLLMLIFAMVSIPSYSTENPTFISMTPSITEIIYALGVQNRLVGVSTDCNYPAEVAQKEKVGDTYFLNKEKIIRLNPNYILTLESSKALMSDFERTKIKPIFLSFNSIEDVYKNIYLIGELTSRQQIAKKIVADIKTKIASSKTSHPKRILYIVQTEPLITIGKKSFITDVIKQSGHKSVSENLNSYYPAVSDEYALKSHPDIIVVSFATNINKLRQYFPNAQIVVLTPEQKDIINRPGPRIYQAVKYFAGL